MTREEFKLVSELFDRLETLEDSPRDPAAEQAILAGLKRAPNAVYALVQSVLVQDEALKRADARIRELEGGAEPPPRDSSFLGSMRQALGMRDSARAGSVPSVRPADTSPGVSPVWRSTGAPGMAAQPAQQASAPMASAGMGGGSFLGTAAAAAAGVVGGSLLLGGIRSMMGGQQHSAFDSSASASPWGGSAGDLSRQAGLDDMGRSPATSASDSSTGRAGLFDSDDSDVADTAGSEGDFSDDGDFGGDGGDFGGGE